MAIGDNIKKIRIQQGLTQEELAQKSNLNRNSIVRYENNQAMPRMPQIKAVAEALNVSMNFLFSGEEAPILSSVKSENGILKTRYSENTWRYLALREKFIENPKSLSNQEAKEYIQLMKTNFFSDDNDNNIETNTMPPLKPLPEEFENIKTLMLDAGYDLVKNSYDQYYFIGENGFYLLSEKDLFELSNQTKEHIKLICKQFERAKQTQDFSNIKDKDTNNDKT